MGERGQSGEEEPAAHDAMDATQQGDHEPADEQHGGVSDPDVPDPDVPEAEPSEADTAQVILFRRNADEDRADPAEDDTNKADANDADEDDDLGDHDEIGDDPVDLAALQADDALLDALGGTNPEVSAGDNGQVPDLETLLVAWRRDVDAAPIGDLVDIDTALAAIAEGSRPRRSRRRHLVPMATAAAVLVIAFTGVGLAARDALPGDMLWGVEQVLYTNQARVVQAATSARIELANANAAFLQGDRVAAEAALKRAQQQMREVDAEHGLAELRSAQESLSAKVDGSEETFTSTTSTQPPTAPPTPLTPATSTPPPSTAPPSTTSPSVSPSESTSPYPTTETTPPTTSNSGTGLFGAQSN